MDPFSISVGVIAVLGLVGKVIKGAEKIRGSLKANDQICALINELTDLKCVLATSNIDQARLSRDQASHVRDIVKRAKWSLSELDLVINDRLLKLKNEGELFQYRLAWLRERSHIESLQKELRYLASAFSLALTASATDGISRIELAVDTLALANERLGDASQARLDQVHQTLQTLHLQQTRLLDILEAQTGARAETTLALPRVQEENDISTPRVAMSNNASTGNSFWIQTTRTSYQCGGSEYCACSCHWKRRIRSPSLFDKVLGSLFVGYTGLPISRQPCDLLSCQDQQQHFVAHFTYYFPLWFVARAIVATISLNTANSPEFTLRVPHIVPDSSPIFQLARSGNIRGIKYLFRNGLASPNDIAGGLGFTPLHVGI